MTADEAVRLDEGRATSVLRTVVLCDLVDSTALVERLGDQRAADLFRRHDKLARAVIQRHGGREIDKTDGFLLIFERPIQAVAFALDYQRELADLEKQEGAALAARIGIHVGDVVVWDNAEDDIRRGAKRTEVEGLVKPVAARLMGLALPRQILLSGTAYDIAHRAQGELGERLKHVRWRTHGRYRFKGVPDLVPVFEVGEDGFAPLRAPAWSGKAYREMPVWRRPAAIAGEIFVLLLLVAVPLWYFLKPAPAIAFANRDWVVVGDLKNLTGESKFDESLQTAFRIGLEQSRYVNALPDLKTRETVKLMQRDPQTTAIDRAVGAEIAIRDGARALILPTVAEIGGRVRVTAEIVDPQTQTTVYSESADGVGEQSVLTSLDAVNRQLRVRLGEALATVSETTRPLEKVSTKNLDALKMYSLGVRQMVSAKFPEAQNFFSEALKLDPDFSGARLQVGRLMFSAGKNDEALRELRAALAHSDRLVQRDQLLALAQIASIESPGAAIEKWKVLADAYPDYTVGTGTYAYVAWQAANRFDQDIRMKAKASASPQNPLRAPALHLLGILDLGNERLADALQSFKDAEALGFSFKPYHAATLAAGSDVDGASALLPPAPSKFEANIALGTMHELLRLSLPLARGDETAAASSLESARRIGDLPASFRRSLLITDLAVLQPDSEQTRRRIDDALEKALAETKSGSIDEMRNRTGHLLLLAWLSARSGAHVQQAEAALARTASDSGALASPILSTLHALAKAQVAIAQGHSSDAVSLIKPTIDGNELVLAHVVLLDAYQHLRDDARALEQASWLADHPGRGYAEYNLDKSLMPLNVAWSRMGLLAAAELAAGSDRDAARRYLARFTHGWREEGATAPVLARVKAVQLLLSP